MKTLEQKLIKDFKFTDMEAKASALAGQGKIVPEVAVEMGIMRDDVLHLVESARLKLGVKNKYALVLRMMSMEEACSDTN
jgi:DNA-binding CsgD family transcriptional regulator